MYGGSKELPEYIIVKQQYADRLFLTDGQFTIPKCQKGKDIVHAKKFVESIIPPEVDIVEFATAKQLECVDKRSFVYRWFYFVCKADNETVSAFGWSSFAAGSLSRIENPPLMFLKPDPKQSQLL